MILKRLKPPNYAEKLWDISLQLFYPHRCGGCDQRGTLFCEACVARVKGTETLVRGVEGLDAFCAAGAFTGPLREAIHKLKYLNDTPLARPLASLLAQTLLPRYRLEGDALPVLCPVPLHRARERTRGYNQSVLVTRELSRLTGWPIGTGLVRERKTRSQVGLSARERLANVDGAFAWHGGATPQRILLVDDVCTTGATLTACAAVLRAGGVTWVDGATVALAAGPDQHSR